MDKEKKKLMQTDNTFLSFKASFILVLSSRYCKNTGPKKKYQISLNRTAFHQCESGGRKIISEYSDPERLAITTKVRSSEKHRDVFRHGVADNTAKNRN